jgi:hypothetical protein
MIDNYAPRKWMTACVVAIFCLGSTPPVLYAAEIIVPLTVRFDLLTQKLVQQLYTGPGGTAPVWAEGDCRHLSLDRPQFSRQGAHLRFITHGTGNFGTEVLGQCLSPLNWGGFIEVLTTPYVTADWQLHLRIVESSLYDEEWKKGLLTGLLWEVTERVFLPQLTSLTIDLTPPRNDLLFLVRTAVPPSEAAQVETILHSASAKAVEVHDTAIVVPLALTVPDTFVQTRPPPDSPEAPLSAAELAAVQQTFEHWDAFLVFVIKTVGTDVADPQLRAELLDLLLASRYTLLPTLTGEVTRGEGDPVRRLFIETWKRLHTIVREAEQRGLLKDKILQYAEFISAGDVLLVLDQATPGLGIEISADGLRRLARMLRPDAVEDPLLYSSDVDPTLRTLFGFSPDPPPEGPLPSDPQSSLGWLTVSSAVAGEHEELAALKERLNRWVPEESEFAEYRPVMAQLLRLTMDRALQDASLGARYLPLCRNMMLATALQESCWRQFKRDGEKITPHTSPVGSIGLMQINQHVWRGFYDVGRLKWETAYNARAGAEILLHYLQRYGVAEEKQTGNLDNAARATYAIYNAGPKAVTRYRARNSSAREKKVDARFRRLYRGFVAAGEVDLSRCVVETDVPPLLKSPG